MIFLEHIAFACAIFVLSVAVTWIMARVVRVMDIPGERSSHARPVPKSGGLAIVLGFTVGCLVIYFVADIARIDDWYFWSFLLSALLLAIVSFIDDIVQASFVLKFFTQVICAVVLIGAGIKLHLLWIPGLGAQELTWEGYVLTLVWIVGMTNAYNFMDGLDGLAAGVAVIAGTFLCVIAFSKESYFVYLISYALVASAAGFLVFNIPPARIFMGDVGSAFIGFTFAAIAIIGANFDRGHLSFYVVPMLLFQFIFDTLFTFGRRLLRGEAVYLAHRTHLYQLLNRMGSSHRAVSIFHYAVAVFQGIGACVIVSLEPRHRIWPFLPFLMFNCLYAWWTLRRSKAAGLI